MICLSGASGWWGTIFQPICCIFISYVVQQACQSLWVLQRLPPLNHRHLIYSDGSWPSVTLHRLRRTQNAGHLQWGIKPFSIDYQPGAMAPTFAFEAKTTLSNAFKVLRAMQLKKSILLEGSPGVGKTGLIDALAKATGVNLIISLGTLTSWL